MKIIARGGDGVVLINIWGRRFIMSADEAADLQSQLTPAIVQARVADVRIRKKPTAMLAPIPAKESRP